MSTNDKNNTTKSAGSKPMPITKDSVRSCIAEVMTQENVPKDSCPTHIYGIALALTIKRCLSHEASATMGEVLSIWELFPKSPSAMRQYYWKEDSPARVSEASTIAAKYQ